MNNYDTYFTIKRVYCLYRVSTLGQVEKDDIPMQKQRCREFAAAQGWSIVRELSEKGVSGFKVSARDRDAIQEIQRDAVDGKFDILLVFMFDRLGRRDDETPFVVEWFVRNGIEVWSATEGQQRFDNHVDKLMNYIRYWQASGESIKTSIRVKTRLSQMTEAGLYTGGTVPYGYHLEKRGRVNKRNREVSDLAIDEGCGAQRLCKYLYEPGIHRLTVYSNSVRSVKASGRANIASFKKAGWKYSFFIRSKPSHSKLLRLSPSVRQNLSPLDSKRVFVTSSKK